MKVTFDIPDDKVVEVTKAVQAVLGSLSVPASLIVDNGDGTVTLTVTGHTVPKPQPEHEMRGGYFRRIAKLLGSDPSIEGSLYFVGSAYDVSNTGDPMIDWPINLDSFANAEAYAKGKKGEAPVVAVPAQPVNNEPVPPVPTPEPVVNVDNTSTPTGVGALEVLADWGPTESRRRFHAVPGKVYAVKAKLPPFSPVKSAFPQVVGSCSIVPAGAGDIQGHLSRFLEAFQPIQGGAGGTCYDRMDWTPEIAGNDLYLIFALGTHQTETDVHIDFQIPTPGVRDANT